MSQLLDLLKKAECGLTREKLVEKAKENGINDPLPQLKNLIDQGLVRPDENPPPTRFKATNAAFQQS